MQPSPCRPFEVRRGGVGRETDSILRGQTNACKDVFLPCSPTRDLGAPLIISQREASCESTCSLQSRCRCWFRLPAWSHLPRCGRCLTATSAHQPGGCAPTLAEAAAAVSAIKAEGRAVGGATAAGVGVGRATAAQCDSLHGRRDRRLVRRVAAGSLPARPRRPRRPRGALDPRRPCPSI